MSTLNQSRNSKHSQGMTLRDLTTGRAKGSTCDQPGDAERLSATLTGCVASGLTEALAWIHAKSIAHLKIRSVIRTTVLLLRMWISGNFYSSAASNTSCLTSTSAPDCVACHRPSVSRIVSSPLSRSSPIAVSNELSGSEH